MKCPLCGSRNGHRIFKLCDNMRIMGDSFPKTPAYVAACDNCGLIYTDTDACQNDFLAYYKNGAVAPKYFEMFGEKDTVEYYDHLLELFSPYINKESHILDIAGSWGELANYLVSKGYEQIVDLDPNEKCIACAQSKGIETILSDSSNLDVIPEESVDFVILNHTLEHILDIDSTMNGIRRILKLNGRIFIENPDVEGYEREDGAPFNFLTYEHVIHMSMNDMENLASKFGFEIINKGYYYKKVSNYPSIYAVMKKGDVASIEYSNKSEDCIRKYIDKSRLTIEKFLRPLIESQEPLILWGIGASTAILMNLFEGCNVVKLVDRNPSRQGLSFTINGTTLKVASPETVEQGTIVILSIPYCESIQKQISKMGLNNRIITLK